jgi:hypothetical protein
MNAKDYSVKLLKILRAHSNSAIRTLEQVDKTLPEEATEISLGIHPNQDPDGMFSILIHLEGPSLTVLNQKIQGHRSLFDVRYEGATLTPPVPLFDPFETDFEVNDVIVDTAMLWIDEIWDIFSGVNKEISTSVFGAEGYGTTSFKVLAP